MTPLPKPPHRFELPPPLAVVLSRLPAFPGSLLLVSGLNLVLAHQLPPDVAACLQGRRIRIGVRDAGLQFDLRWQGRLFQPCSAGGEPDLTLSANAHDFLLLAQRREDPDTLFFNRRLSMEGDTELGLVLKNALDALEWPVFNPADWHPPALLQRLQRRLQRHSDRPVRTP